MVILYLGEVVDMTEACPRISAKPSLSKQSLLVGMPLWVPNSDFTLIYLTRTFHGLGLSPHISTLAYKVPDKETQHIQFPHTRRFWRQQLRPDICVCGDGVLIPQNTNQKGLADATGQEKTTTATIM